MTEVGWWPILLEAAGMDPLRAQKIDAEVNQLWWERFIAYREAQGKAAKIIEHKQARMSRR